MGIYLYTLRKSRPHNTQLGPVYRYQYKDRMAKTGYWEYNRRTGKEEYIDYVERQEQYVERLERDHDHIANCLVTVGEKPTAGDTVYRQDRSVPVWWDCDTVPGVPVGVLRKRGRSWYVSTPGEEVAGAMDFLQSYAQQHGLVIPADLSGAYDCCARHFNTANMAEGGYVRITEHNREDHIQLCNAHSAEYLCRASRTIATANGRTLRVRVERYVMSGLDTGTHSLDIESTDLERLNAHWKGYSGSRLREEELMRARSISAGGLA